MFLIQGLLYPKTSTSGNSDYKGWFIDQTALETAYPVGENGWFANVGSTDTIWIWDSGTTAWVNSGVTPTVNLPFTGTIEVDGTLGNDTTGNGNLNAPYQTIQKALDEATAGNAIYVAESDYAETLIANCAVSIIPKGAVRVLGTLYTEYSFYAENLGMVGTTNATITFAGYNNIHQLINCDILADDPIGTTALRITGGVNTDLIYIKGGSLKTTKGSSAQGYILADTEKKLILDNVDTDLGDDHNNYGIVVLEYLRLEILSGTKIDGQIYNPDGGETNIYSGVTLMKTPSSSPAITAGTANTNNTVNIYPGVICNSSATPAFVGDGGLITNSGGIVYPFGYDITKAFSNTLSGGGSTYLPTSSLQPATQTVNITDDYSMIDSDCLVNYVGTGNNDIALLNPESLNGRIVGVVNNSGGIIYPYSSDLDNGYVSLMPNESAIFQVVDNWYAGGTRLTRIGGWNPAKLQNIYWVSKNGSDDGLGNITSPFLTISAAMNAASDGDQIIVTAGDYAENIYQIQKALHIVGWSNDIVNVIGNAEIGIDAATNAPPFTFENINFISGTGDTFKVSTTDTCPVKFINCNLRSTDETDGGRAISFISDNSESTLELENCSVSQQWGLQGQGAISIDTSARVTLKNVKSYIDFTAESNVLVREGSGETEICDSNFTGSVLFNGNINASFTNCSVYSATAAALDILNPSDVTTGKIVSKNSFWGGDLENINSTAIFNNGQSVLFESTNDTIIGQIVHSNDCYSKITKGRILTGTVTPIVLSTNTNTTTVIDTIFDFTSATYVVETDGGGNGAFAGSNITFANGIAPLDPNLNASDGAYALPVANIRLADIAPPAAITNGSVYYYDGEFLFDQDGSRITLPTGVGNIAWDEFIAYGDGSTTVFNLANTPTDNILLFREGQKQVLSGDYTITGNVITFYVAPTSGDVIQATYPY